MKDNEREYYLGDKKLPIGSIKQEYTPEMIKEMLACAKDIIRFTKYFYITSLEHGKEKIKLYRPQKRLVKALVKYRFNIILSSRQIGKTTVTTIYALWVACFNKDKTILIVANKEDTAKEILLRIKMAYEQLPNWLKPGVEEWAKTEVKFTNDSRISISTTSSSAARGLSINCVDGSSIVTLKDKTSGDIFDMSMKDFHELLEKDGELLPVSLVED